MAPELIRDTTYNCSVDIWAFGITVLEIIAKRTPYAGASDEEAMCCIRRYGAQTLSFLQEERIKSTPDFLNFLLQCLDKDPSKRATASSLLKHQFLSTSTTQAELKPLVRRIEHLVKEEKKNSNENLIGKMRMEISTGNPHRRYKKTGNDWTWC